jgi:CheY-like chemotaxis protein
LEVREKTVVVDTNHRRAGLALDLEIELVGLQGPPARPESTGMGLRKAVAFDVDAESLISLQAAFPEWEIEAIQGVTAGSLERDWSPGTADLVLVGARDQVTSTLGLCRSLRSQAGRAYTPLLVLVTPEQQTLIGAVLAAGAHGCLVLPVHAKELASGAARAAEGNRPGRHTLGLHPAQVDSPWQDEGGEA